jgi:hypothetical protein
MDERLVITLKQGDATLPVDELRREGVIFGGERDAWPRALTLEFDADDAITRNQMNKVRARHGWEGTRYDLKLGRGENGGYLAVQGKSKDGLPAGNYWFRLRIGDLRLPAERTSVKLKKGGVTAVELPVRVDPRQVEVSLGPTSDAHLRRVVGHAQSQLDGLTAMNWLLNDRPRASRKACLLNVLAKLRAATAGDAHLLAEVRPACNASSPSRRRPTRRAGITPSSTLT